MNPAPSSFSASKKQLIVRLLLIASIAVVLTFIFSFSLYSSSFSDDVFTNSIPTDSASSNDPLEHGNTHYQDREPVVKILKRSAFLSSLKGAEPSPDQFRAFNRNTQNNNNNNMKKHHRKLHKDFASSNNNNNNDDDASSWKKFCSQDPAHSCYSPKCFSPLIDGKVIFAHHQNSRRMNSSSSASSFSSSFITSIITKNKNNLTSAIPPFVGAAKLSGYRLNPELKGRGCFPNPFYHESSKSPDQYESEEMKKWSRGRPNLELTCAYRKSERTKYFEDNLQFNSENDPLFNFKKHTSWMFSKWYDWGGKCVRATSSAASASSSVAPTKKKQKSKRQQQKQSSVEKPTPEELQREEDDKNFILHGYHDPKDGIYRMKNVCLRPRGGFGGYYYNNGNENKKSPPPGKKSEQEGDEEKNQGVRKLHPDLMKPYRGTQDTLHAIPNQIQPRLKDWLESETWPGRNFDNFFSHHQSSSRQQQQHQQNVTSGANSSASSEPTEQQHHQNNDEESEDKKDHTAKPKSPLPPHHFRLDKPASCYLDTRVLLLSVDTNNPGHAYFRTGYAQRCIESIWGKEAMMRTLRRDNKKKSSSSSSSSSFSMESDHYETPVTIGYVGTDVFENTIDGKDENMKTNKFHYYYDILGTSWFSIIGYQHEEFINSSTKHEDLFGFKPRKEDLDDQYVCFREVAIATNGHLFYGKKVGIGGASGNSRGSLVATSSVPGAQTMFHIHGPRSPRDYQTTEIMNAKIRSCAISCSSSSSSSSSTRKSSSSSVLDEYNSIEEKPLPQPRRRVRPLTSPHVILAVRSQNRRISLQPYLISFIAQRLPALFGPHATFEVLEHSTLAFHEVVERFTNCDVVISLYGANLMWSIFMPPGGVVIEINNWRQGYAKKVGIASNPLSEYGGISATQGLVHISVTDENILSRFPTGERGFLDGVQYPAMLNWDHLGSFGLFEMLLRSAACSIERNEMTSSPSQESVSMDDRTPGRKYSCNDLFRCCAINAVQVEDLSLSEIMSHRKFDLQTAPLLLNTRFVSPNNNRNYYSSRRLENLLQGPFPFDHEATTLEGPFDDARAYFDTYPTNNRINTARVNHHQQNQKIENTLSFFLRETEQLRSIIRRGIKDVTADRCCRPPRFLFIEPCRARASLWAEISALRQVFRVGSISVAEYSSSSDTYCREHEDENENENEKDLRQIIELKQNRRDQPVTISFCNFSLSSFTLCDRESNELLTTSPQYDFVFHDCYDEEHCTINANQLVKKYSDQSMILSSQQSSSSSRLPSATDVYALLAKTVSYPNQMKLFSFGRENFTLYSANTMLRKYVPSSSSSSEKKCVAFPGRRDRMHICSDAVREKLVYQKGKAFQIDLAVSGWKRKGVKKEK